MGIKQKNDEILEIDVRNKTERSIKLDSKKQ
jgi:hypothetical protein